MTKKVLILGLVFGLCGCASTQLPPIDDAYYAPSIENPSPQTTQSNQSTPSPQTIEYINVQDTTVTIRIK